MRKNKGYYEKQINGLILIIKDCVEKESFITRAYVVEKLRMILESGINFHPIIELELELK